MKGLEQLAVSVEMDRLNQVMMEDIYSRTNLRELIIKDIEYDMEDLQVKLSDALDTYRTTVYGYDSKNIRVAKLRNMDMMELAAEIFIVILPLEISIIFTC